MALINCPECGKENVSNSAESCPICGYGIKKHFDELKLEEEKIRKAEQDKKMRELEEERQKEELDSKAQCVTPPQSKPFINGFIIIGFFFLFMMILFILIAYKVIGYGDGDEGFLIVMCGFFAFVFLVGGYGKLQDGKNLYEKYSKNQDEYKRQLVIAKEREEAMKKAMANKKIPNVNSQGQVYCPKCGSTQIQAVPRKWSLMTGFLTNKIDRVCLNCKHKF